MIIPGVHVSSTNSATSSKTEMLPALAPCDVLAYLHVMLVLALKVFLATGFGIAILALL
jgi:hypothetical protein